MQRACVRHVSARRVDSCILMCRNAPGRIGRFPCSRSKANVGAGEVATAQPGCGELAHRSDSGSARRRGGRLWGIVDIRADGAVQGREHEVTAWTVRGIRLGMGSVWACVIHTLPCPSVHVGANVGQAEPTGPATHGIPLEQKIDRSNRAVDPASAALAGLPGPDRPFSQCVRHRIDRNHCMLDAR